MAKLVSQVLFANRKALISLISYFLNSNPVAGAPSLMRAAYSVVGAAAQLVPVKNDLEASRERDREVAFA